MRDAGVNPTALVNDREDPGYHRLAYQPLNYAASCKFCNTSLKRNYFPIAAAWKTDATTVTQARTEDAYLIYPIGTVDRDPEAVIEFHGVFPQARAADGSFEHQRALVTIELFSLDNDRRRKSLFASRARSLAHLHSRLREQTNAATDDDRRDAEWWIDLLTDRQQPHANCMRCFKRLYERDKDEARTLVRDARRYVARMSGRTS